VTLDKNVEMIVRVGTNECSRFTANEQLGYGINYIQEVPIDNPRGARYAVYSAQPGEQVNISVYRNGVVQPLMSTSAPPIGASGSATRLDLNMGTDADHDGLSDVWETQLIIWNSGGRFTNITQVLPGDDFDGDGVSNQGEFQAATAPQVAGDCFQVYRWMYSPGGSIALRFLTVKGVTYEIKTAPAALKGQSYEWSWIPFRAVPTGSEAYTFTAGASGWQYFYVQPQTNTEMIRLEIAK
jgi:hypothetical protein